jgi:uncharacterized protein (DUF2141 family)
MNIKQLANIILKKIVFFIFFAVVFIGNIFANDTIRFALEITGINVNQGQIYVKIYSNDRDYRNDIPYVTYVFESTSQSIVYSFDILEGEYLIALFQDTNNNGKLDTNFLGFPKEPVGLSNYGGGIPGGFNRQKIPINNNSNRVTINMGRV